jgi:hypothetical protein
MPTRIPRATGFGAGPRAYPAKTLCDSRRIIADERSCTSFASKKKILSAAKENQEPSLTSNHRPERDRALNWSVFIMRKLTFTCLAMLCPAAVLAQASPQPEATATTSGPSAWVYVSSMIGTTARSDVYGYTASSTGTLSAISGSPFPADLSSMAVNGLYLFGAPVSGSLIDTYRIESNGALHLVASTNASAPNKCANTPGPVFLDHTGATLYDFYYWGDSICSNSVYQSWNVVKSSGSLAYVGAAGGNQELTGVLSFIGNNAYGYTSDCYHSGSAISGFKRNSNGSLTELTINAPWPTAPSGEFYCPYLAAADPTNHLAIPVFPCAGGPCGGPAGPWQLAVYTVQSNGQVTTTSTYANMPKVAVGSVTSVQMAPSGKLLAVAGTGGLQVFHFNGASPITAYTGLLTTSEVDQMFWDNTNHLYAIGTSANKLWVFTITPTTHTLTATYSINKPVGMIVQPLPLPW